MLKDKVVLISGASSGIGAITARMLAEQGAIPVLTGRNAVKLRENAAAIAADCAVYQMDVTNMEQVQQTVEAIVNKYGKIDILLNNAGFGKFDYFVDAPVESFEQMMDTNYMGIVRCTKAVLPYMLERRSGHIINIASMAGKIGSSKSTGYSASKHAVLGFTNSLRMELKGQGIYVSAVNPGPIATEFFAIADPSGSYVKNISWFMMKPEYVAKWIIRVMLHRRAEVDLPKTAAAGIKLYQLFPRWADCLFGSVLNRK